MSYRATPHSITGFSPFYSLQERDMLITSNDNLRAKILTQKPDHKQRLEILQDSLRSAYKPVHQASRKSHIRNKEQYDHKAKMREFNTGDLAFLYKLVIRPGLSKKFHKPWSRIHKITAKISDLNYRIDKKGKEKTVHVNRIKPAHNPELWKPKTESRPPKKLPQKQASLTPQQMNDEEEAGLSLGPFPILEETLTTEGTEQGTPTSQTPDPLVPNAPTADIPSPKRSDPNYLPPLNPSRALNLADPYDLYEEPLSYDRVDNGSS
jgi:hypothetical protein